MEKTKLDEFLKAVVSAFVWVASADNEVNESEFHKFAHALVQSPFATQFNETDARRYFKDMVAMFSDDFESAMQLTITRLRGLRGQSIFGEEIIRVCRAAVVGDGRLEDPEEVALDKVTEVLGL
jgi:tellurite resistance protein